MHIKHGMDTWHSGRWSQFSIIGLYLLAIVAANITVTIFGPTISVLNAFLFIGFNLTARDKLHDAWHGKHLKRNMFLLILTGSVLSFALGAGRIAIASFVAFAASESVDAIGYHFLRGKQKLVQVNGSNVFSAAVDSILFPLLAFGWPLLVGIVVGQFLAKVFGGAVWSVWLNRKQSI
jgi:uncharacterized PurR-regulated membrane protein YhhQ (DUF165 family)